MLIGSNAIGDQQDYVVPGTANAFQVTAKATSTLNSLAIYLDPTSTATSVVLGVYSDHGGSPGTLSRKQRSPHRSMGHGIVWRLLP